MDKLSYDPDAGMKRRLKFVGRTEGLPDFRYMVGWGELPIGKLKELEAAVPFLTVADGDSKAKME